MKRGLFPYSRMLTNKCEGEWQSWKIPFCNHHSEDCFGLDSSLVAKFRAKVWWAGYLHLKVSFYKWLLRFKVGAVTITMYIEEKQTNRKHLEWWWKLVTPMRTDRPCIPPAVIPWRGYTITFVVFWLGMKNQNLILKKSERSTNLVTFYKIPQYILPV